MASNERLRAASGIRHYRPELDAVRFFAFFTVFLHHCLPRKTEDWAHPVPWWQISIAHACGFGLCLFFVLSAYLISDLLMRERERSGRVDIPAFFQRRIRRIWPLYILGLLIGTADALYTHGAVGHRFLAYFFLAGNWYCVFYGWSLNPMTPLWSISIEEQFYLLWPGIARYASRRIMFAVCGVLLVVANVVLYHLGAVHADADIAPWANSFTQFQMFACGILIALVLRQRMPRFATWGRVVLFLAWPLCWFFAVYTFHAKQFEPAVSGPSLMAGYALAAIGSAALLLALLGMPSEWVPRWLAYLGRISYGLYVFHLLARQIVIYGTLHLHAPENLFARDTAALALTIAMAAVSYKYFEEPILRRKPVRV